MRAVARILGFYVIPNNALLQAPICSFQMLQAVQIWAKGRCLPSSDPHVTGDVWPEAASTLIYCPTSILSAPDTLMYIATQFIWHLPFHNVPSACICMALARELRGTAADGMSETFLRMQQREFAKLAQICR